MRRIVYIIALAFLVCFSNPALSQHHDFPYYRYMEATKDSEIYSWVGEHLIKVGLLKQGQAFKVAEEEGEDYYAVHFGNEIGYIAKKNLKEIKKSSFPSDPFNTLHKKVSQNLMVFKVVRIHSAPDTESKPVAILQGNLRYPILDKLQDASHHTWYEINLGDRLGYISDRDAELDNGIPLLTYHHVLKATKHFLHTSTITSLTAFREQMAYLKRAGYTTISFYELESYLNSSINLPAKVVGLTFDDGLKSVYRYAYPILKENGQKATLFIISSRIKRHPQKWDPNTLQFLSLPELYAMQDVFDFQSHTHFLHRFGKNQHPILLRRSYHNILYDFERSRRALSRLNPYVLYLSYPFGGYNLKAIKAAQQAGFHLAVTTVKGKVKLGDNPFALKRLYILRTDPIEKMAKMIANEPYLMPLGSLND
ncbi:polysaccharide deacetylase family protein [Xenorhabdus eapokensis]|uniref:Xylanase/chitin deacetylase n=1 Tax=Xenorhabdus eapokensis TaxID=1873482 RepID=A0A1Q5TRE2_9GAMM|nr:polysaccharide deacetylase family protein [Xenorhabdus eapokensis]OKP02780.1 xylanase/chitin deacetylase [Xenorhabdus eapokensis]